MLCILSNLLSLSNNSKDFLGKMKIKNQENTQKQQHDLRFLPFSYKLPENQNFQGYFKY